ncbi:hypothetical protein K7H91_18935 [Martelella mediterranea]|uniref:hypothetical protein n=1 Tax=Martelella mediterranea TaxID=293089 RepID=UPI001E2F9CF7|nr:hypothetical protein [Martelella mediterranea]MCD1635845.1 hypothetical protein [Martelella mediterranea]
MNHQAPIYSNPDPDILVERIRSIIGTVALDCYCRLRVNDANGSNSKTGCITLANQWPEFYLCPL